MSRKSFIIFSAYTGAVIAALAIFSFVSWRDLSFYRTVSAHASQLAFEETVKSVESMSQRLKKAPYATDASMRSRLCAGIYADALAAEAAMSSLPFTTHELEQISGYVNQMGDYAYALASGTAEGFEKQQREDLARMAKLARQLSESLRELQTQVHEGSILIDSLEERRGSSGMSRAGSISGEFERFERDFPAYAEPGYEGSYASGTELSSAPETRRRSDAELLAMAAGILGASPAELSLEYEYQNSMGRKCYRRGDTLVCVGPEGVETVNRSRLVAEETLSLEEAQETAAAFLEKQGLKDLSLYESAAAGGVARLSYVTEKNGVLYPHERLELGIALDDGSLYSYSAVDYSPTPPKAEFAVSAAEALSALPEGIEHGEGRKLVLESPVGKALPCYAFDCVGREGEELCIYVNAQNGRQQDIEFT